MRTFTLLLALALLPATASAEAFTAAHDVRITSSFTLPRTMLVELDEELRMKPAQSLRLIDDQGLAVPYRRIDGTKNLMPVAIFDAVPIAAGTVADNTVERLRDGSISTVFQPVAAESFRFRFHFVESVSPDMLEYTMDTANVSGVQVRIGNSFAAMHDAFVGLPSGTRIPLSGERARAFEITFTMRQGVPRIGEMKLLEPQTTLLFRAAPARSYTLLSGGPDRLRGPEDPSIRQDNPLLATLGPRRALTRAERDDHDGVFAGDNCPDIWNPGQEDRDGDVVGDVCDNCPDYPNSTQEDANGNGIGDVCEDNDRDGVANAEDNCPDVRNSAQLDADKDGVGNSCDNVDDRFTSGKGWLLWVSMTLVVLILAAAGYAIVKRSEG